jgi:hypothetical protein
MWVEVLIASMLPGKTKKTNTCSESLDRSLRSMNYTDE